MILAKCNVFFFSGVIDSSIKLLSNNRNKFSFFPYFHIIIIFSNLNKKKESDIIKKKTYIKFVFIRFSSYSKPMPEALRRDGHQKSLSFTLERMCDKKLNHNCTALHSCDKFLTLLCHSRSGALGTRKMFLFEPQKSSFFCSGLATKALPPPQA